MSDFLKALQKGRLTNLSRRTSIDGTSLFTGGQVELSEFKMAGFGLTTRHTREDAEDMAHIWALDATAAAKGDFEIHRRELLVAPLRGTLDQINRVYSRRFDSVAGVAEWNQRIEDFVITMYGNFTDDLSGQYWSHTLKRWLEIDPPRPEHISQVVNDMAKMLNTFTQEPYAKHLTVKNSALISEMFSHLKPHIDPTINPPAPNT